MMTRHWCLWVVASVAWLAACGSPAGLTQEPPDAAAPADGPPIVDAAAPDAAPDAPPAIDADGDGVPADRDCDDHDPNVWQLLFYSFRDADLDGHTVASTGTVCSGDSLPAGYLTEAAEPDCDDGDPAVFTSVTGFVDSDGDGFGDGTAVALCTAGELPAGYAAVGGDCAPDDASRWRQLFYTLRDADGDGAVVSVDLAMICSGDSLPPGYLDEIPDRPFDCDDTNPNIFVALEEFPDLDGDGVGSGTGQVVCTDGTLPPGFSTSGSDCDDGDPKVWASLFYSAVDSDGDGFTVPASGILCTNGTLPRGFLAMANGNDCDDTDPTRWVLTAYKGVDVDGDGFTAPASGQLCTDGTLPPPFKAVANGNDCNDNDPKLSRFVVAYPDQDGDGVGAPPRQIVCTGSDGALPAGLVRGGYDEDDHDPTVIETEDLEDLLDLVLN